MITALVPLSNKDTYHFKNVVEGLRKIGIEDIWVAPDSKHPPIQHELLKGETFPYTSPLRWHTRHLGYDILNAMDDIDSKYILKVDADIFIRSRPDWLNEETMGDAIHGFRRWGTRNYFMGAFYCMPKTMVHAMQHYLQPKIHGGLPNEDEGLSRIAHDMGRPAIVYSDQFHGWHMDNGEYHVLHLGERITRRADIATLYETFKSTQQANAGQK